MTSQQGRPIGDNTPSAFEAEKGGFFQFPLCVLATREPMERWLMGAFCFGVIEFINTTEKRDFSQLSARERTRCLQRAQDVIGFSSNRSASDYLMMHRLVINKVAMLSEKTFTVRLKTKYYIEMANESMLSERNFRVLVGLYSLIGPKLFGKAGWPMIQARAAGHLSVSTAKSYLGPIYSRWQIEQAVSELLDRRFLVSVTYNRGERFWSHRLGADELAAAVTSKKTRMVLARHERMALNAKVSLAITNAGRALITCRSSAGQVPGPAGHQHLPGTPPNTGASTSPSTLQESPSAEPLIVEAPPTPSSLRSIV